MPQRQIFISYASKDKSRMQQMIHALRQVEIPFWVDVEELRNGDLWLRELETNLNESHALLVLMSVAARESEWVERECLWALNQKKPIFIARYDHVPLPLHLINRQFTAFEDDFESAFNKLIVPLRTFISQDTPETEDITHNVHPTADNFFEYLLQMPNGKHMAMVAKALYEWAQDETDSLSFSGKHTPALHAKVQLEGQEITLFSVVAYLRNPMLQVSLENILRYPPYNYPKNAQALTKQLAQFLPNTDLSDRKKATLPLASTLDDSQSLEIFMAILREVVHQLKAHQF
jgi:hypothetical protein